MRSVLITGGSGYLGRGLVRQLLADGCDRICVYSRGEHTQASMRVEFNDDKRLRWFIGDVRDVTRLERAMHGVDTVIHAAALKRIEVGAYCPDEMVKTNVLGSMNVLESAERAGVVKAVLVSSDKAYQPVSPYGQSKALAESLFLTHAGRLLTAACRYGNVAGSTGSVITIWRALLASGKHAIVTDPECTRFWMTRQEAVQLVLQAARYPIPGKLSIPDLPAYRLGDLALAMGIAFSEVGLPAHEKRHESMDADRCSATARRMTVDEIREALTHVE